MEAKNLEVNLQMNDRIKSFRYCHEDTPLAQSVESIHTTNITPYKFSRVGNYPKLTSLGLWQCLIDELPDSFENLKTLEDLDLSTNLFDQIPDQILKLPQLKTLDMSHQNLRNYDNLTRGVLPQLETFVLSGDSADYEEDRRIARKHLPSRINVVS